MQKVIVFGAAGRTGKTLVIQALERGYQVTAFARNPSRIEIEHPSLTIVEGDAKDSVSVTAAVAGQDAAIIALGTHPAVTEPLRTQCTENIITAMKAAGTQRVVCASSMGVGDSAALFPEARREQTLHFLRHALADHLSQESVLQSSNLEWVVARPSRLTEGDYTGRYQTVITENSHLSYRISRADLADFMLNQLDSDIYLQKTPSLSC